MARFLIPLLEFGSFPLADNVCWLSDKPALPFDAGTWLLSLTFDSEAYSRVDSTPDGHFIAASITRKNGGVIRHACDNAFRKPLRFEEFAKEWRNHYGKEWFIHGGVYLPPDTDAASGE